MPQYRYGLKVQVKIMFQLTHIRCVQSFKSLGQVLAGVSKSQILSQKHLQKKIKMFLMTPIRCVQSLTSLAQL